MPGPALTTPSLADRQAAIDRAQGHVTGYGGSALTTPVPTQPVVPEAQPAVMPTTMTQLNDMSLLQRQAMINTMSPEQRTAITATQGPATPELIQPSLAQRQAAINRAQGHVTGYNGMGMAPGRPPQLAQRPPQQRPQMRPQGPVRPQQSQSGMGPYARYLPMALGAGGIGSLLGRLF